MRLELTWLRGDAARLCRGVMRNRLWSSRITGVALDERAIATEGIADEAPGMPTGVEVAWPFVVPRWRVEDPACLTPS